jgi:hypothetical protein
VSTDDDQFSPEKAERLRQRMASLDGKTGRGGCEFCDATYEFVTIALGESELRIFHEPDCDRQLQWLVQLRRER